MPAEPGSNRSEEPARSAVQAGIDGSDESAGHITRDGIAGTENCAHAIHDGPVARVVSAAVPAVARVVAGIALVEAVLVREHLLQTADRVAGAEVHAGHRAGHGGRELVGRHVDQAVVDHGLVRAGHERLRGRRVGKQAQDVLDQLVHDRFPPKSPAPG
nr:hypothetical protein [Mycobacterium shigaense]